MPKSSFGETLPPEKTDKGGGPSLEKSHQNDFVRNDTRDKLPVDVRPSFTHPHLSYADVVKGFKIIETDNKELKVKAIQSEGTLKISSYNEEGKKIGKMHAQVQRDADLWKYPAQLELKQLSIDPEQEHVTGIMMQEYKKFVEKHEVKNGEVRRFTQVESHEVKKLEFLEKQGWRRTQQVRQMDKDVQAKLLNQLDRQKPSTDIREATNFGEVREQMADLHTLNAGFNKKFTLADNGLDQYGQIYKETIDNKSGAWVVHKDQHGATQGLMALIKDGENNKIEVEAFIVAKDLRTQKGMREDVDNRPSHRLMREGLRIAQEKLGMDSKTDVFLYVTEENKIAQNFYEKRFGFKPTKYLLDLDNVHTTQRDEGK